MPERREWGPTWVGRPKLLHPLGDKAWSNIEELVRTECRRAPPPQFRAALNEALTIFQAQRDAAEATSPKAMRTNLGRADKATKQLVSALEQLDDNSRLLLSRAIRQRRPRTMRRNRSVLITGSNLLHRLSRALTIALADIPRIDGRLVRFRRQNSLATISEQHQIAVLRPEPAPIAGHTRPAAPRASINRHFRRTSPVGLCRAFLQVRVQHRAACLGRRSSIISKMRRNRSCGSATSAIWNVV